MQSERWQKCIDIFHAALECPVAERAAFLRRSCEGDEGLRTNVESMLEANEEAGDFIQSSALEAAPEFLAHNPEALLGQHLGSYRIDAILGVGGMGVVYLAWDERLDRKVGLKLLPPSLVADEARLERLEREARTASALNHPNIVTVYEIGEANGAHYIATEFIEGNTLRNHIANSPIPPGEALDIAIQIASALCVAHEAGIVHRDIKPENIMLRRDGYVKVLDFGIAKFTRPSRDAVASPAALGMTTQPGMILGTARYMSPEQARGQSVDAQSDVWSLGVVIYEMLTGQPAFAGETPTDVMAAVLLGEPQSIGQRGGTVPPALQRIVETALRKNRAERFKNAEEMLAELRAVKGNSIAGGAGIAEAPTARSGTIAVLPLENLSHEPGEEYFPDGMTEALITDLAKIGGLTVISRGSVMSFKGTRQPLAEIGRTLGVEFLVEGSVLRDQHRVRISARLVRAATNECLWAERYDRELADVLALQDEVARAIASAIDQRIHGPAGTAPRRVDPEVYLLELRGRHYWHQRTEAGFRSALRLYEEAIARDPTYAPAHLGIAVSLNMLANYGLVPPDEVRPRALAAVQRALALDEKSAEAHAVLAFCHWQFDFAWEPAFAEFEHALELAPSSSITTYWFGISLGVVGFFERSQQLLAQAQELDPLSLIVLSVQGWMRFFARRFEEAVPIYRQVLRIDPDYHVALWFLGEALIELAQYEEGLRALERAYELAGRTSRLLGYLGYGYGRAGQFDRARECVAELEARAQISYVPPYFPALVLSGLREYDHALDRLEQAYRQRDTMLRDLKVDAAWDGMRHLPRFGALMRQMAFPDAEDRTGVTTAGPRSTRKQMLDDLRRVKGEFDVPEKTRTASREDPSARQTNLGNFFAELKRRNVYRVMLAYAFVGWLVIQVSATVVPALHLSDRITTTVVVLTLLGFPIALLLAWAFELTPEGIKRTEEVSPGRSISRRTGRMLNFVVAAALLVVIAFFIWERRQAKQTSPGDSQNKSLAVLPFENRSEDKANAYFADGIQDEILTRLSKIGDLKVIARSSTEHYKSVPENLPEIAKQLGVTHIVEGSVQKSGDVVRVNVQLIKAANAAQIWAETFDRKLTDIFGVESEVAKAIADQLQAKVTGNEQQALTARLTDNPEAYDAYLRGLAFSLRTAQSQANALGAQKYFKEAVRLDPKFALAWALLAYEDGRGYISLSLQPTPALLEEARQAAETALNLQPNLGEALHAKGFYHYACLNEYDTAVRYFEQARQFLPNSSRIPESLAYVARRRGQWDRSESFFNEAERFDPRNVRLLTQHALSYIATRRLPEALRKVDQILDITPDDSYPVALKASVAQLEGDLPRAAALLAPLHPNADNTQVLETQAYQAILERNPAQLVARLKEVLANPDPALGYNIGGLRFYLGWVQELAGNDLAAQESWQQARRELEPLLKEQSRNYLLVSALAFSEMKLGDKAAALQLAESAVASNPMEKDAVMGARPLEILARVAALAGESDRAIGAIETLLSTPYGGVMERTLPLTPALLRLDPMFDSLRNDSRFEKLASAAPGNTPPPR